MALLFRLSNDGQKVYISESSSKIDFDKNVKVMDVNEFMRHLPSSQMEKVRALSSELRDLSNRKIGELEVSFDVYLSQYNSMNIYYYINGENYTYVEGDTLPTVTDDDGNVLSYTFVVDSISSDYATITFSAR